MSISAVTPELVVLIYRCALALPNSARQKRAVMNYAHRLRRRLYPVDDSADLLVMDGVQ